jgi:hypothetical protein
MTLSEAIAAYAAKFDDFYPIFMVPQMPDSGHIELIRKCLREGKPTEYYHPTSDDPDVLY